jgi:hypothetical protein
MLAGQNARPMVLSFDDLTPALGQRSIQRVSPLGSGYAAGSVTARERLAFQWIECASQAWESLADGRNHAAGQNVAGEKTADRHRIGTLCHSQTEASSFLQIVAVLVLIGDDQPFIALSMTTRNRPTSPLLKSSPTLCPCPKPWRTRLPG